MLGLLGFVRKDFGLGNFVLTMTSEQSLRVTLAMGFRFNIGFVVSSFVGFIGCCFVVEIVVIFFELAGGQLQLTGFIV